MPIGQKSTRCKSRTRWSRLFLRPDPKISSSQAVSRLCSQSFHIFWKTPQCRFRWMWSFTAKKFVGPPHSPYSFSIDCKWACARIDHFPPMRSSAIGTGPEALMRMNHRMMTSNPSLNIVCQLANILFSFILKLK